MWTKQREEKQAWRCTSPPISSRHHASGASGLRTGEGLHPVPSHECLGRADYLRAPPHERLEGQNLHARGNRGQRPAQGFQGFEG